jgi:hypothetical protein
MALAPTDEYYANQIAAGKLYHVFNDGINNPNVYGGYRNEISNETGEPASLLFCTTSAALLRYNQIATQLSIPTNIQGTPRIARHCADFSRTESDCRRIEDFQIL